MADSRCERISEDLLGDCRTLATCPACSRAPQMSIVGSGRGRLHGARAACRMCSQLATYAPPRGRSTGGDMDHQSGEGHRLQASLFPMSAVRGRHPDDLNEGTRGARRRRRIRRRSKHAFEWWYFDAPLRRRAHLRRHHTAGAAAGVHARQHACRRGRLDVRVDPPSRAQYSGARASAATCACAGSSVRGAYPAYDVHMER